MPETTLSQWGQAAIALLPAILIQGVLLTLLWSFWQSLRNGWKQVKQMHQVPCSGCVFFTGDYHLKCTVNPHAALTEDAIACIDYLPCYKSSVYS